MTVLNPTNTENHQNQLCYIKLFHLPSRFFETLCKKHAFEWENFSQSGWDIYDFIIHIEEKKTFLDYWWRRFAYINIIVMHIWKWTLKIIMLDLKIECNMQENKS